VLVDLPGHYRSPLPAGRLTIDAMADAVGVLLQRLREPPAHVVGLSLGGCVGLALALRAPERVRSLTIVNAFARLRPAGPAAVARLGVRLALLAVDARAALARVRCPTLVMAGADDATVGLDVKETLARAIPGARFVVVPDSGHATNADQPETFNATLRDFLTAR